MRPMVNVDGGLHVLKIQEQFLQNRKLLDDFKLDTTKI